MELGGASSPATNMLWSARPLVTNSFTGPKTGSRLSAPVCCWHSRSIRDSPSFIFAVTTASSDCGKIRPAPAVANRGPRSLLGQPSGRAVWPTVSKRSGCIGRFPRFLVSQPRPFAAALFRGNRRDRLPAWRGRCIDRILVPHSPAGACTNWSTMCSSYGLVRASGERVAARHTWNCYRLISNALQYNLPRHSAHHLVASRPFWSLARESGSPTLPYGYQTMAAIAVLPPLWRRIMKPLLDEWDDRFASEAERAIVRTAQPGLNRRLHRQIRGQTSKPMRRRGRAAARVSLPRTGIGSPNMSAMDRERSALLIVDFNPA